MTDLVFDDPCVLFALPREARGFLRDFRAQQHFPGAPCQARFRGPEWLTVLVLQTGIGARAMLPALEWLLARPILGKVPYRPKVVISAGFAGALRDEFHVGDVILATEIVDSEGTRWPTTWPGELPAGEWRPPLHRARLLGSAKLVGAPAEKHALGQHFEAAAVDMESAVVARLCSQHDVPFACLRVISDNADTALSPALLALLKDGRISPWRTLVALCQEPRLVAEMWRLARDTRIAAEQLRHALGELLTLTLPWGREL